MSASDNLSKKCSGLLLRSSFAIFAARARHLLSAVPMPAFSVAPRSSNSSDIVHSDSFDLVRHQRANERIFLYAFDLIELNGDDLRRDPLEVRKATLASIVAKASPGIRFNEHMEGDGPTVLAMPESLEG